MYPSNQTCPVHFRDPARSPASINYSARPTGGTQARLRGRELLVPDLDLGQFECRAVVDWVKLRFTIGRQTHLSHLRRLIGDRLGAKPHVAPGDATLTGHSTVFVVTVQEPEKSEVDAIFNDIARKHGIVGDILIDAIEISVDFRPHVPSDRARAELFGVLQRSFWTSRDVFSAQNDRPRCFGAEMKGRKMHRLFRIFEEEELNGTTLGKRAKIDSSIWLDAKVDTPASADGTLYVGARNASIRWRLMDKVKDQQNRKTGTFKALSDAEKRVRVEVTLSQPELGAKTGLHRLHDLQTFRFTTLQKKFFRFMLPTFQATPEKDNLHPMLNVWIDRMRIERFLKTGILGLEWSDRARDHFRKPHLAELKKTRRSASATRAKKKKRPLPVSRNYVAYEDLCWRIQASLRHLGERWR